jgi:hypothetical protein
MAADRTKKDSEAERDTRNRGLKEEEERLHEPGERPPHTSAEQAHPEPERPTTPQEDAEDDIASLENPPQSEGPRERGNKAV